MRISHTALYLLPLTMLMACAKPSLLPTTGSLTYQNAVSQSVTPYQYDERGSAVNVPHNHVTLASENSIDRNGQVMTVSYKPDSNIHALTPNMIKARQDGLQNNYPIMMMAGISTVKTTHIVRQNETTYSLAKHYCSTVREIQLVNDLGPQYTIKAGQTLSIPRTQC